MSDSKDVSANLLVGKAMSWNLVAGPIAGLGLLGEGEGALLIQLRPGVFAFPLAYFLLMQRDRHGMWQVMEEVLGLGPPESRCQPRGP